MRVQDSDKLELVAGDGSDKPLDTETLQFLKARAQETVRRAQQFYSTRRADGAEARYCEWQGQTADGLVQADTDNQEVEPFDGASDQRVRWCDQMANEDVVLLMTALSQAQMNCVPRGRGDADGARRNTLLLRYLIDEMGVDWWLQNWRMASYMVADDPALAAMRVEWRSERRMEYRTVTAKELAGLYVQREVERLAQAGLSVETAQEQLAGAETNFLLALMDKTTGDEDLTSLVMGYFVGLKRSRAAKIVRDLRAKGVAEFPLEIAPLEGVRVRALQYGVDFTFDSATTDWDRCRAWFEPVWMTAPELRAAVGEQGWSKKWVDEVLKHEGEGAFLPFAQALDQSQDSMTVRDTERYKGLYQVVWAHFWATNEDDVKARYEAVVHMSVGDDGTDVQANSAFGQRMQRNAHGKWEAHLFVREILDRFLTSSRGIPSLVSPMQGPAKVLTDAATNNGIMGAEPPVLSFGYANKGNIAMKPFGHLPVRMGGDVKWMQPPAFPATTTQMLDRIRAERDAYLARGGDPEVMPPEIVKMARQWKVFWFLENMREVLRMMLLDARQNASEELLLRVTDDTGAAAVRSRADLEGEYDVEVAFNPANLDDERVIKVMESLAQILPTMDRNQTIDTSPIAAQAVMALMPNLPRGTIKVREAAAKDELAAERDNLKLIRFGFRPDMNTQGKWDYAARRQMYRDMEAENPQVFLDMGDDKKKILMDWWAGLEQQEVQFGANKEIGKSGMQGEMGMRVE
jgi:hypothetical protein